MGDFTPIAYRPEKDLKFELFQKCKTKIFIVLYIECIPKNSFRNKIHAPFLPYIDIHTQYVIFFTSLCFMGVPGPGVPNSN